VDFIDPYTDDVDAGIAMVREYLRFNKKEPVGLTNRPKLYFIKNAVPQTIKALQSLQYKEWKGVSDDREDNERIMERHAHAADTLRYLCVSKPQYRRPKSYHGLDEPLY
jgi:hypothetical protein